MKVGGVHQVPIRRTRCEERSTEGETTSQGDRPPTKEVDYFACEIGVARNERQGRSDLVKEERLPERRWYPTRRLTLSSPSKRLEKREPEVIRFPNARVKNGYFKKRR